MYSKCIVSPFMSTPMAMIASKGAVDGVEAEAFPAPAPELAGFAARERSVVEEEAPRRSPALREEALLEGWVEDWICEAE
jgi:hypothetical protein